MNEKNPIPPIPESSSATKENNQLDYSEAMDVQEIHGAILREHAEPQEGREPVPLWLLSIYFLVIFWGGGYLFWYSGGFRSDIYNHVPQFGVVASQEKRELSPVELGQIVFRQNCAVCHGNNGAGQAGNFPPLAGSEWVLSDAENRLPLIVLNGLVGPIEVKGSLYNNAMQPFGGILSDEQIANVLTYVRQAWGNDAGRIYPEGVAAMRKQFESRRTQWTAAELLAMEPARLPQPGAENSVPAPSGTEASDQPVQSALQVSRRTP